MDKEDFKVTEAMIKYGGSFVRLLGAIARHADNDNLQKIKDAWPDYWKKYKEMSEMISKD